ncbi:hypothetical protein P3L10_032859 [Capsicum annuum]
MDFPKFLIVFLLLIMPFSIASISLGATTNQVGRPLCFRTCSEAFTVEDCKYECKGRHFQKGRCENGRCCCRQAKAPPAVN